MKAGWQLMTRREDLWVKVIRAKYCCGGDLVPRIDSGRAGSNFWKGIKQSWNNVEANITWRIGNRRSINCWKDHWIPSERRIGDLLLSNPSCFENSLRVSDLVDCHGNWSLDNLVSLVPDGIIQKILSLRAPSRVLKGVMIGSLGSLARMGASRTILLTAPCWILIRVIITACSS